eukprot:3613936-Pyramimonas_sp.AAC.1
MHGTPTCLSLGARGGPSLAFLKGGVSAGLKRAPGRARDRSLGPLEALLAPSLGPERGLSVPSRAF